MKYLHFLMFFLLVSCFPGKAQETIVLQPGPDEVDDAIISLLYPESNYADYGYLVADAWTHTGSLMYFRSLIEFDLSQIPINSTITEAKLSLFGTVKNGNETHSELSGSNEAIIARVIEPWNEYNVTWNDQPGISTTNEYTTSSSNVPYEDFIDMNVTDIVQDMVNNPGDSYGFRLKLKDEIYYRRLVFASSDNDTTSNHPILEITYEPASPAYYYPKAPSQISASYEENGDVTITWKDNSDNESSFVIERALISNGNFQEQSTTTDTFYIDTSAEPGVSYQYRVKAVTSDSFFKYSGAVEITPNTITIDDENDTICDVYFMDPAYSNIYNPSMDFTQTIYPATAGKYVRIEFSYVNLSSDDYLEVYNGTNTTGELLKKFTGDTDTINLNSFDESGALTFKFLSSFGSKNKQGWYGHFSCIDVEPAPTALSVTESNDTIWINWTDNATGEDGYIIYRSEDGTSFLPIDTVNENVVTYFEVDQTTGTHLFYKVRAIKDGINSGFSNVGDIIVPGLISPSDISISSVVLDSLEIYWTDNSDDENGFILERSINSSPFEHLAVLSADSTSFFDKYPDKDSLLVYRVNSFNAEDTSDWVVGSGFTSGTIYMFHDSIMGCDYYFTDPGGGNNYPNNSDITTTLWANDALKDLRIGFDQFQLENGFDYLKIYDGSTTSSPLIGNYSGSALAGEFVTSSNAEGCLTLRFTSDGSVTTSGWEGFVQCLPKSPNDLTVTPGKDSLSLSWTDYTNDESGYIITRSEDSINFTNLDTVIANTTSYTDRGLLTGKKYYYRLGMITEYGMSYSNIAWARTLGPAAPSGFSLNVMNLDSVHISWIDNAENENGFIIERKLISGDFELLINLQADSTSYYDNISGLGSLLTYRIASYDDEDTSYWVESQEYVSLSMEQDTITACGYVLLDPGGKDNYSNNLDIITFLYPGEPGEQVYLQFEEFNLENNWDFLEIYNGDTIAENLIEIYTSSELLNETVYANNNEGFLSLKFTSDNSGTREGFRANVGCYIMPDKPENLSVSAGTKSLSLAWTDISTQEWGYIIYRSSDSIDFMAIDTVAADINSYIDEPLETGHKYFYKVAAYHDIAKNFSGIKSNVVPGPLAPTGLTAHGSDQGVQLQWNDNSDNETGFVILRSDDGSNYDIIDSVGVNIEEYVDTNVTIGNSYYYKAYAYIHEFSSDYSNSASITITTIEEIPGFTSLKIFPNPGNGIYNMNYFTGMEKATFKVFDVLGKTVGCHIKFLNKGTMQIDISHLQDGIYLLKIYTGNKQKSLKLIKE